MREAAYDRLLGLLEERREIKARDWDYDPHNYRRDQKIEDMKKNTMALDVVFSEIIDSL